MDLLKLTTFANDIKSIGNYKEDFSSYITKYDNRISTGSLTFDKVLSGGLADELYIMGAETSTGKSAFMMDIAESIASQGVNVLYFSLEMSKHEFIARGISKLSFIDNKDTNNAKYTAADILYWNYDESISDFVKIPFKSYSKYSDDYFKRYGENLFIIEGGIQGLTVKDIANICSFFKENHSEVPLVVFVDYLQIIKADADDRAQGDRKTKMDSIVTTLKTLASQIGMPVFTVSSIGRSSYKGKVSTSAFKESGDTEYTGGVLLGWNWVGVTNATDEDIKKKEIEACHKRGYRKMELEILKFRNSKRDHSIRYKYYPAYNYFVEDDGFEVIDKNESPFPEKEVKRYVR